MSEEDVVARIARLEERISGMNTAIQLALSSAEKALVKADYALEKRLDNLNELRGAMQDQAKTYLPRAEYNVQHEALAFRITTNDKRITDLQENVARAVAMTSGKSAGTSQVMSIVLGIFAIVSGLSTIILALYHIRG